jgi:cytochrome c-type biogenesis protein CcmH/NrfF
MPDDEAVAMQVRCPQCRRENYALAVSQISKGGHRCVCGHVSRPMTLQEYRTALRAAG